MEFRLVMMALYILLLMVKWYETKAFLINCKKMGCAASTNSELLAQQTASKTTNQLQQGFPISNLPTNALNHSQPDSVSQQLTSLAKNNQQTLTNTCNASDKDLSQQKNEHRIVKKNLLKTRKRSFDTILEVSQQYWCSEPVSREDGNSGRKKEEVALHERQTGCLRNQQTPQTMGNEQALPMFSLFLPKAAIQPQFQSTN